MPGPPTWASARARAAAHVGSHGLGPLARASHRPGPPTWGPRIGPLARASHRHGPPTWVLQRVVLSTRGLGPPGLSARAWQPWGPSARAWQPWGPSARAWQPWGPSARAWHPPRPSALALPRPGPAARAWHPPRPSALALPRPGPATRVLPRPQPSWAPHLPDLSPPGIQPPVSPRPAPSARTPRRSRPTRCAPLRLCRAVCVQQRPGPATSETPWPARVASGSRSSPFAAACAHARSSFLMIFPAGLRGTCSMNSTRRGRLYGASSPATCASSSAVPGSASVSSATYASGTSP